MPAVCTDLDTELVEFNGANNHVPPARHLPTQLALANPANPLNGVPSRRMGQEFPDPLRHYYRAHRLWSGSYLAGPQAAHRSVPYVHTSTSTTARFKTRSGQAALPRGPSPPP